ncbi:ras guanine nucleotide exchange factor domain-containing protein [Cokeromyces recurvatus]|uniref:ras guanine nucleotide exchange factor domain-containing protein n=1 Tax=Cokeromyces recurvatus TaxID=90255 RepID=UPI002220F8BF|nr:ras guanine nucleotide exchange factor domain-containing protein [Cokeromyces recurvatus]KAI7897506.1 ras guanine nucleotide exchange factor domain-containing protein [Cokeromyces recurvatus]
MLRKSTSKRRNNSVKPFESTTKNAGSKERAALAAVFGVEEYTEESKIVWQDKESDTSEMIVPSGLKQVLLRDDVSSIMNRKSFSFMPANDSFTNTNKASQEQLLTTPADLSNYSLTIFDQIESDENTRLILWSSNTTDQQQTEGPDINCRSSTLIKKKLRWSAHHILPSSFKSKIKYLSPLSIQNTEKNNNRIIEAATIEKLIEKLTIVLDYTFMTDFFLIYRVFMTSLQLCKFLILRFKWSLVNNEEKRRIVRIRTFVVLRHWLLNYFMHDFVPNEELVMAFTEFLNEMSFHSTIKHSSRDKQIIKELKRIFCRLKKNDCISSQHVDILSFSLKEQTELQEDRQIHDNSIDQYQFNAVQHIKKEIYPIVADSIKYETRHSISDTSLLSWASSNDENRLLPPLFSSNDKISCEQEQNHLAFLQIKSDELTTKLNQLQYEQNDEEPIVNTDFGSYPKANIDPLNPPPSFHLSSFVHHYRPHSFYNAQLAIPSGLSTPDNTHLTTSNHYFEECCPSSYNKTMTSTHMSNSLQSSGLNVLKAKSDIITVNTNNVRIEKNLNQTTFTYNSQKEDMMVHKRKSKTLHLSDMDPKIKPLPPLISSQNQLQQDVKKLFISYSRLRQFPSQPSSPRRFSLPQKIKERTTIPKSRMLEIDLDPQPTDSLSVVLKYSTSLLVEQLCLIEKNILLAINWEELVDCQWTKMASSTTFHTHNDDEMNNDTQTEIQQDHEERGIEKAINRFNAVCQWVSSEIVQARYLTQRVKLIEKFIRLAKKCKLYCNFASLIQILLGLQSPSVSRLEKTWSLVNKFHMKTLQDLSQFTSPIKNWKHLRDTMTHVTEDEIIRLPFGGCIPFLGIYLSDLIFNAELPSYLYHEKGGYNSVFSQPLVHFRKHRITATIIKRVLVFQNLANKYYFEESSEMELWETCLKVPSLDRDIIQNMSYEIEPLNT